MAVSTVIEGHATDIPGLIWFDVSYVGDDRGWFQEKFQIEKLTAAGMPKDFQIAQNSLSYNENAGVTRGFHAEPWDKYISVVKGKVFCCYVDLRKGSGFGKKFCIELDNTKTIFLPQGVANSFQTLEDDTYYLYSVNKLWSAEDYDKYMFVNLADPVIAADWPINLNNATLSERDKKHPLLNDIEPMEISA
jgi:dTDP-4-dehydrorhamnose 3,5-epimerase